MVEKYISPLRNGYCSLKDRRLTHRHCRCEDIFEGDKEGICKILCNDDGMCKGYSYSIDDNACEYYTASKCKKSCQVSENKDIGEIRHHDGDSQSGCHIKIKEEADHLRNDFNGITTVENGTKGINIYEGYKPKVLISLNRIFRAPCCLIYIL